MIDGQTKCSSVKMSDHMWGLLSVARTPNYRIVGKFRGRKLSQVVRPHAGLTQCCKNTKLPYSGKISREKTSQISEKHSRIAHFCRAKGCHIPNFLQRKLMNSQKNAKFTKVFSFESFPLCGNFVNLARYNGYTMVRIDNRNM